MDSNSNAIKELISWTYSPEPPEALRGILARLTDQDMLALLRAQSVASSTRPSVAARLAWMEFGRRHRFIDFKIDVACSEDRVDVTCVAPGKAILEHIKLVLSSD